MRGWREIGYSFAVGMISLVVLGAITGQLRTESRYHPEGEAVQGDARGEDAALSGLVERVSPAKDLRKNPPTENGEVVVAIVDTGCDVHHPALSGSLWQNPGETGLDQYGRDKASNGVDDDGNGYIDDVHGWNFSRGQSNLEDDHGHGTHIAGIVRKASNESAQVKLMILKYYDAGNTGQENMRYTIEALRYAVKMGAKIVNYSGGGLLRNSEEEAAIRWAGEQGVLVVAAAGNEGLNSDFFHFYPADYEADNVLSVAALDRHGGLIPMSNYGRKTVDLGAPGKNIYSTLPNGEFGYMTGTSQATAWVTGAAALLQVHRTNLRDPKLMIASLLFHASPNPDLKGRSVSGGELNIKAALENETEASELKLVQVSRDRAPAENAKAN